jgi:tetratricopeptide (TPR) repeat protein
LQWFWLRHGHLAEGRAWLAQALELVPTVGQCQEPAANHAQLRALNGAGLLARAQGDYAAAERLFQTSLVLARKLDETAAIADAFYWLAVNAVDLGDRERGFTLIEESLALWRQVGDP